MDDIVRQAMVKWPHVPHCYGWLGLDQRGNWYLRDDAAQAAGAFASGKAGAKGSLLRHEKLMDFIQRNYACDDAGQWFFQNGPQRVYVELEVTPWVWRVDGTAGVRAHDGQEAKVKSCLVDENGFVYLDTSLGIGLVHTQDVGEVARVLESGRWAVEEVVRASLPQRYHYISSPKAVHMPNETAT
jgi:hypothetical protein